MMTEPEFESLLRRAEGETIDFKAAGYDLSSDHGKFSLVKDVISLANTPRDANAHVLTNRQVAERIAMLDKEIRWEMCVGSA